MSVVHCKKEKFDVYIGRPEKWGNPFFVGEYGRDDCILKYKLWLNTQRDLLLEIPKLKGKTLGCWCSPEACHGDVLSKLSESKWISNWFSNMLPLDTTFEYEGISYKTTENFYQAMKLEKNLRPQIAAMNPYVAKRSIRNIDKFPLRKDWDKEESLRIMEIGLREKFKQGTSWRTCLDMTEDWEIVEWNNWNDTFWGKNIYKDEGENNLGKILMKIRNEI